MKLKALVVDNSEYFRKILLEIFQTIGVECHAFATGEEGLRAVRDTAYDFILATRYMEDMGGEVFLHRARERGDITSALTILITTDDVVGVLMAANAVGYKIVFHKKDVNALQDFIVEVANNKILNLEGKVLYIEAQINLAKATMDLFARQRTKISHFPSLSEAKLALASRNYDLVISDYDLDDNQTADTVVDYVRDELEIDKSQLPILILSSQQDVNIRVNLLKNGANDVLLKPYHADELIVRVSNLITAKKLFDNVKLQQKELMTLAMTDQLTGLYNRRSLFEIGPKYLSDAKRHGFPLSMLVIDLDFFKNINDTFGHAAGDSVLKAVGRLLTECCRTEDFVARFGGEEFVIILPHCNHQQAAEKAEEIRKSVYDLKPDKIPVSASIGAATLKSTDDFDVLFNQADSAVYQAKQAGRNCVVVKQC